MFFNQETSTPFEWIRKLKLDDRYWARAYLSKKGLRISELDFEIGCDKVWVNDAHHREINQQIRNAWRQRRARKSRTGKKAYNFVLTNDSKLKLDKISKSMHSSITEALENIIEHENKRIDEHKAALKYMKEKIQETRRELEQENANAQAALKQLVHYLQKELNYNLLNLSLKNLKIKNPATLHTPSETLKDRVTADFHDLKLKSIQNIGLLSAGLPEQPTDTDELWRRLIEAGEA